MTSNKEKLTETVVLFACYISVFLIGVIAALLITSNCNRQIKKTELEVDTKIIDSIQRENIILEQEINKLDSSFHEEVSKVKELNNDSTLKLFYELIRK